MANRFALILHGYPKEITEDHPVFEYFKKRRYKVIAPDLFTAKKDFSLENAVKTIKSALGKNYPDVILGFSMGGLILPYIAKEYPHSKLIFISTGTRYSPEYPMHKFSMAVMRTGFFNFLIRFALILPDFILMMFYRFFNPCKKGDDKNWYLKDKKINLAALRKIPPKKHIQIFNFVDTIDNSKILKSLKNKTVIILSGRKDILMPVKESIRIKEIIPNSKLILVEKSHFAVITEDSLKQMDKYLQ